MPFLFLLIFIINIYADDITLSSTFKDLPRICIYNKEGTTIKADLKLHNSYDHATLYETLLDASGVIDSNSSDDEVKVEGDNLREKVVYYILNVSSSKEDYQYDLNISGLDAGWAGRCPSDAMARVANTSAANIANAALLAGVVVGLILFIGFAYALTPNVEDHRYE